MNVSAPVRSKVFSPVKIFLSAVGALVLLFFAGKYWRASATTIGSEFSPYSFSIRDFQYIAKTRTDNQPSALLCPTEISMHLSNSTVTSGIDRWDLVNFRKGFAKIDSVGEAAILTDILGDKNQGLSESWKDWSDSKPKLAAILWPAVQQLAIHQAYFAIPELLERVRTIDSEKAIKKIVDEVSIQAAIDQAHRLRNDSEYSQALVVVRWGKTVGSEEKLDRLENSLLGELE
jgi:hypothetical protein